MLELDVIDAPLTRTGVVCAHCEKPLPAGAIRDGDSLQFCCSGCKTAYAILHDDVHALSQLDQSRTNDSEDDELIHGQRMYAELDHPKIRELYVQSVGQGLEKIRLYVTGIHCSACVLTIEKLPRFLNGVVEARANLANSTVTVIWQVGKTRLSEIAKALDRLGYPPHPVGVQKHERAAQTENRNQLVRLAVAGACAGNTMLIAFALYSGFFTGISSEHETLFRWASAILAGFALVWPGSVFFKGAASAIRTWTPHMDLPVALGLAAGGGMGLVNTYLGRGEIYFDSLTVLIFLLLVGRYIQFRQQSRAIDRVALLRNLTPRFARRIAEQDGAFRIESIPVEALEVDDVVELRAGDVIPADGVILAGESTIDRAILTGESVGVPIQEGDQVPAGATNLSGVCRMRADAVGDETRLGRLVELVEIGSQGKTPIVQFANRIGGYFVVVVTILAIITAIIWWPSNSELAINNSMALLIVACPCALGLATPLTLAVAQGRAASQKILIKSGDVLERLSQPGTIWLDKTGTITEGKMAVRAWFGDESVKSVVVALERAVVHPLADAIVRDLSADGHEKPQVADVKSLSGMGVTGMFNGLSMAVGNETLLSHVDGQAEDKFLKKMDDYRAYGWTTICVAVDGDVVAVCAVGDEIRDDVTTTISDMKNRGWSVGILSGDHPEVVQSVARQVGIEPDLARGHVSPEDKLKTIREHKTAGPVVMVGDGVNDSAALAAADVGIAVHGGAETSLHAATVYLDRHGLSPILELIDGAGQTLKTIYRNFATSICYNLAAVGICMAGLINPLIAAVLMPISSLSVLSIAMLNKAFQRKTA